MNYVFPELPYYSKEWIPILEEAKLTLHQEDYLCIAVAEAAIRCEGNTEELHGKSWVTRSKMP